MIDEFEQFLHSSKTADQLSEELLEQISHASGLEGPALTALEKGRDLVVAGTAGTGKTHLLRRLTSLAAAKGIRLQWPRQSREGKYVRVIPDATEFSAATRGRMLEPQDEGQTATVIAINEGPLLDLARSGRAPYDRALLLLHEAQRGILSKQDRVAPVVIDAGSFDPISAGLPATILGSSLLAAAMERVSCTCEHPSICPRRRAWSALRSDRTLGRVTEILELLPDTAGVDFRAVWDFVEDVATGGECTASPPTSPWFWRLFFGTSSISGRLRAIASPRYAAFPRQEARLWYGDWDDVEREIQLTDPEVRLLRLESTPATSDDESADLMLWIKAQLAIASDFEPIGLVRDAGERQVAEALQEQDAASLIDTLNRYMTYQMIREPQRLNLHLWVDLGVEMRIERPRGHVSLGAVPVTEFSPTRSLSVANHPDPEVRVFGSRKYLVHRISNASLPLTGDFVALLLRGRSYRTAERVHTDAEWKLRRFFYEIARGVTPGSQLKVIAFDFQSMSHRLHTYTIANGIVQIEH